MIFSRVFFYHQFSVYYFLWNQFRTFEEYNWLTVNSFISYCRTCAVDEDLHLTLAHQMYKSGSYKKALEHSNTVYERNPLRTDNLLLLGAIYYQVCYFSTFVSILLVNYLASYL